MSLISTKTPIFDDIPSIEFFNGRLLTGEDMTTEQAWNAARRKLLGQALGSGVAFGLNVAVSIKPEHKNLPVVTVEPGLALNANGETLSLTERSDVSLVQIAEIDAPPVEFGACQPTQYGAYVKSDGVYLLTLCPATGTQGRAAVSGLANQEARCNRKYRREGVQFRLHQLKLSNAELADRNKLRNLVAYKCFSPEVWQSFVANPFSTTESKPKLLDGLLVPKLDDAEVPLATLFWTTDGGIEYVDVWSVRRRPVIPPSNPGWQNYLESWVVPESEARLQQVQQQLSDLADGLTTPGSALAITYFRYLPAVGMVPVTGSGSLRGFRPNVFFGAVVRETPKTIDLADAVGLIARAGALLPIDLPNVARLYLYWVKDNLDAVDTGRARQRYLLYSTEPVYPIDESVRKCLLDAASAYAGLLAQGKFVPADGVSTIRSIVQYTGLLERIVNVVSGGTSMLYRATDNQIITVYQALYSAQADFVAFLSSSALGSGNVDRRQEFVSFILKPLNEDQGAGSLSLKSAIAQSNVKAAVIAQNRVTSVVLGHSGEITVGNLDVVYLGDDRGTTLVIADPEASHFTFRVFNKTNRRLDVDLMAAFSHPREDWNSSVSIVGESQILGLTPFNPQNPTDPKAFRDVAVSVTTPGTAVVDQTGVLVFRAEVPAPVSIFDTGFVQLKVGLASTPSEPNWVRFEGVPVVMAGNPNVAQINERVSLAFAYQFHSDTENRRNFKIKVESQVSADITSLFDIDFSAPPGNPVPVLDQSASTSLIRVSNSLELESDKPGIFQVDVWPLTGANAKALSYQVKLESVDGTIHKVSSIVSIIAV
jgi:hypothetical protein